MSHTSMRRAAVVAFSAMLVATGLTIGVGPGVAGAAECSPSSHATKRDFSTVWITHNYTKTVTPTEVAAGGLVTYKSVVGTTSIGNPYLNTFIDYPPAGFGAPVKATVKRYTFPGGQQTAEFTPVPNGAGYQVTSPGWFINASNPVVVEMTYQVPEDTTPGSTVTSGGIKTKGTVGIANTLPNLTACFTVRHQNPGEVVDGSLDDSGFGSGEGQLSATGSLEESLARILGDVLDGLISS
ncbi:hypothetical protein [Rhodococcus xishaensis]|uniref:Uncharacterized protein n=1 Tax=Rhodococcus xishaensis TaxID=2487364 RepID=A0A3S3CPP7_9NOCA|nr:hypothetical protein [Rhodococcus xishaensis]RVW02687.1 hypothetical protein EGT50_07915 [Rhodococcus xishaensis]